MDTGHEAGTVVFSYYWRAYDYIAEITPEGFVVCCEVVQNEKGTWCKAGQMRMHCTMKSVKDKTVARDVHTYKEN